jgi:hypothetical protein
LTTADTVARETPANLATSPLRASLGGHCREDLRLV